MRRSTRTILTTGIAALSVGALVTTPSLPPESLRTVLGFRPVTLATEITQPTSGVSVTRVSDAELETALALIEQLAPVTDGRLVTVGMGGHDGPGAATVAPAKSDDTGPADSPADAQTIDDPAPLNAASDLIDGVYSFTRYWANYVSLELGPWLINWIPFGYLISDQIYIWYPDFVLPVVDSFVYDFLDPVVNNPLDLGVWINGIGDIINTAVTGVYNGIVSEIDYVLSFGWFPIPLPPLPDFPLPGLTSDSAVTATALTADDLGAPATDAVDDAPAAEDAGTEDAGEEATEDGAEDGGAELPATEDPGETVVDDTEAPAEAKRHDGADAPVDDVDEGAEIDEESTEVDEEADDPAAEVSEDAPEGAADEPDTTDADQSGDEDTASDSSEQSDSSEASGDETGGDTDSSESDD
ncbi:Uncharacterised protein [Mycolicibacterium vanbaalenii]|uniref:Uncharacterized protein n=1 Tax=Mycolicibacterium vanbaalenii TaxID=110539 RepID=A0A5S9R5C7_MYCVN|nr:hypothetical protein [Mycolicibacterium vanbaalenii]CAA0127914.1 Uncharacterised protein [Mycolicibacterium vanbaalenii]